MYFFYAIWDKFRIITKQTDARTASSNTMVQFRTKLARNISTKAKKVQLPNYNFFDAIIVQL